MIRIEALDHVVLTVADVEATAAFYESLGMERITFEGGRTALAFGEQKINLHAAGAEVKPNAARAAPGSADFCLLIEGPLDAVVDELATLGIPVELGPVDRTGARGRIRSVYFRDPDGNLVELAEPLA